MNRWLHDVLAGLLCLLAGTALAQDAAKLRVKVFPGAQNLPLYAALAKGFFNRRGLAVELLFTQNSVELRDGLANGDFEVAHAAVDNAVAMVELAGKDVVIVMGGDSSMNELFVQAHVASVADLRGRTVIVDAPNTAYALQLKKLLLNAGLKAGDYNLKPVGSTLFRARAMKEDRANAASILNPPFSIAAQKEGMKSLGRAIDLLGPYQATGAFVMRPWARANDGVLERYVAGYIDATRWVRDPANRDDCLRMLSERLKLEPDVAARTYETLMDPAFGLSPDAKLDVAGFRNVLALRAEIEGQWGGNPPSPERYLDPGFYERGMALAGK
ncbi:MAG: ABC transporter substrate-binding protein [Betaproteobacteria bacterium]|nr:ABC transporter substrate-binding protein [Betaproteobacteria bacterium]